MKKVRIGNDIRNLEISVTRLSVPFTNWDELINLEIYAFISGRRGYYITPSQILKEADKLKLYFDAKDLNIGEYDILIKFSIDDISSPVGRQDKAIDIQNAFEIVEHTAQEYDSGNEFSVDLDYAHDGLSYYQIWAQYFEGTIEDMIAWHRQPAIDAASLANEKANLADTKAGLANDAANLANEKANLADTKAGLANDAANLANEKANLADTKAGLANDAANLANEKANLADTKAGLANDAANLANEKANLADTKAGLANDAASLANEKANLADTKAGLANDAANLANEAAAFANEVAAHPPIIQSGTWHYWDATTNAYVDTNIAATPYENYLQNTTDTPVLTEAEWSVWSKEQGDYAKEQGDYAKNIGDTYDAAKVDKTSIVNTLTETTAGKVLDARQGKVLNDGVYNTEEVAAQSLVELKERIDALEELIKQGILNNIIIKTLSVENFQMDGASLILTGAAAPAIVPDFIGQFYIKTTATTACYQSTGTSAVGDWKQIG